MKKLFRSFIATVLSVALVLTVVPTAYATDKTISQTDLKPLLEDTPYVLKELTEKREERVKHFLMSDRTVQACVYPQAVHYLKDGEYKDIDNTLVAEEDYYKTKENSVTIKLPKDYTEGAVELSDENGYISFRLLGAEKQTALLQTASRQKQTYETQLLKTYSGISYKAVKNDVDLQYDISGSVLKETIVLYKAIKNRFFFDVQTSAVDININADNSVSFYNKDGTEIYRMDSPFMIDSAGETSSDIEVSVVANSTGYTLIYAPSYEWLSDAARVYPVSVDPTVHTSADLSSFVSTYYTENSANSVAYGSLYVGNQKGNMGKVSSAFKFELPQISETDIVLKAAVALYHRYNSSVGVSSNSINIHQITAAWTPASTAGVQGNPPSHNSAALDYATVGSTTKGATMTWDITPAAKAWYDNPAVNYGLLLKAANEENWAIDAFSDITRSSIDAERPFLIIHYMDSNGLNPYQDYTSLPSVYRSSAYINNYTGNLTYSYNDIAMPGTRSGITINHYYNSADYNGQIANDGYPEDWSYGKTVKYGAGFRTNLNQHLYDATISGINYLVYVDADGTKNYFKKNSDGTRWEYEFDKKTYIVQDSAGDYNICYEDGSKIIFWKNTRRLYKIIDSDGNTLTLEYGMNGEGYYVSAVVDGLGQRTTFSYNTGYLAGITDSAGRTTTFTYNGEYLHKITDSQGGVTEFLYNADGYLSAVVSPQAQKTTFDYGNYNQRTKLKKVIKATEWSGTTEGRYWAFNYKNGETTVTDRDGASLTSVFDFVGRSATKYDRDMNVVSVNYVDGATTTDAYGIATQSVDTKVEKTFSEKFIKNLVNDSSGESQGTYWWQTNWGTDPAKFTTGYATDYVHSGNVSQKVTATAQIENRAGRGYQLNTLVSGKTYTFSAYVKTENVTSTTGGGVQLYFVCTNTEGTETYFNNQSLTGTNDWTRISLTFTVPADTVEVRVHAGFLQAMGTAWFDDFQLEEGAVANRYNYVQNGSFDFYSGNQPAFWTKSHAFTGQSVSVTDRGSANGRGVSIVGNSETNNAYYYQNVDISLKKGQLISFSCWARAESIPLVNGREFSIDVSYNYVNNGVSGRDYQRYSFDADTDCWQYLKNSIILKGDTEQIELKVLYRDNANTAVFDDFQLFVGDDGQSYQYYTSSDGAGMDGKLKYSYDGAKKTSYTYDTNANLSKITYPDGKTEEYTYDSNKRIITAKDRHNVSYSYTYDSYGNPLTMTVGTAPNLLRVTNEYSNGNMLYRTTDANGGVTTYNYHAQKGTLQSVTDPNGATTVYTYDNYDRLLSVSCGGVTVTYNYDRYNLLSITTGNETVYNLNYDTFLDSISNIKVGTRTLVEHQYAAYNGRLTRSTYGNGDYVENVYESLWDNTITGIKHNGTQKYSYFYDNAGNIGKAVDSENNVTYTYSYDEIGRPVAVNTNENFGTTVTYNEHNEPTQVRSTFLMTGRYAEKFYANKEWLTNITYYYSGFVGSANFGYGMITYNYDNLGRRTGTWTWDNVNQRDVLTSNITYRQIDENTATTQVARHTVGGRSYDYTYDSIGNIKTITVDGVLKESYSYDSLGQLVRNDSATQNKTIVYSYDNGGNIQSCTEYPYTTGVLGTATDMNVYTYGNTEWKDLLTEFDGEAITYDNIGNPLSYRGATLTWSNGRRLASYTDSVYNIAYKYNDGGQRTYKTVNGQQTKYYWNLQGLVQERRPNGDILSYMHDEANNVVAFEHYCSATETISFYYYIRSIQGDIVAISDRTGTIIANYYYDAYGNIVGITDGSGVDVSDNANHIANINPYRYRGYYYDSETGLYYMQSRYYDSQTGRFVNADGFIDNRSMTTQNLFQYCGNNPISFSDSAGNLRTYNVMMADGGKELSWWDWHINTIKYPDYEDYMRSYLEPINEPTEFSDKKGFVGAATQMNLRIDEDTKLVIEMVAFEVYVYASVTGVEANATASLFKTEIVQKTTAGDFSVGLDISANANAEATYFDENVKVGKAIGVGVFANIPSVINIYDAFFANK